MLEFKCVMVVVTVEAGHVFEVCNVEVELVDETEKDGLQPNPPILATKHPTNLDVDVDILEVGHMFPEPVTEIVLVIVVV